MGCSLPLFCFCVPVCSSAGGKRFPGGSCAHYTLLHYTLSSTELLALTWKLVISVKGCIPVQGLCGRVPCCSDVTIPEPFLNWAEAVWTCRSLRLHLSILKTEFAGGLHCSWQHGLHCCVSLLTFVILSVSEDWLRSYIHLFWLAALYVTSLSPSLTLPSACWCPQSVAPSLLLCLHKLLFFFWPRIIVQLIAHKKRKNKPRLGAWSSTRGQSQHVMIEENKCELCLCKNWLPNKDWGNLGRYSIEEENKY